jgi:hypothetical protein
MTLIDLHSRIQPSGLFVLPLKVSQLDVDSIKGTVLILTSEVDPGRDAICIASVLELNFNLDRRQLGDFRFDVAGPQAEIVLSHNFCTFWH